MSTFILVHGAYHGSWCWDKVVPLLCAKGHSVEAPDLPGSGNNKLPISDISLQCYVDFICDILNNHPEPAILVGHSMGGPIISQVAEYQPDKVKTLVYLSAHLLRNGESLLQLFHQDLGSLLLPNTLMSEDRSYSTIRPEAIVDVFYHDCSEQDIESAKTLLGPQAYAPVNTPISITEDSYGKIARIYIECLKDRALTPKLQEQMYGATPCQSIIKMNTGHSPFFSASEELADHLMSI